MKNELLRNYRVSILTDMILIEDLTGQSFRELMPQIETEFWSLLASKDIKGLRLISLKLHQTINEYTSA